MFLKKIDDYILNNILNYVVFYTFVPTFILWVVQSRHILELAIGGKTSIWVILKLSSYLIPPILPHILPFSVLLGSVTVLVRLYNDSEMSVLWASGLSPVRLMKNFYNVAFIVMIIILIIHEFVAPQMSQKLKIDLLNIKNDIIQTALKPNTLQTIPNANLTVYIDTMSANSYIKGFFLQQKIDNHSIRIFTAKEALLTEKNGDFQLLLLKGRILNWNFNKNNQKNKSEIDNYAISNVLEFDKFTLNISDVLSNFNNAQELQFKARDYSITDLLNAKYAKNSYEKKHFLITGHENIIASFFPLVFISFVLLFMMRPIPPRGFPYRLILQTIFCAVLYRIISSAVYHYADNNFNIVSISYGLHSLFIVMIMLIMFTKRNNIKNK